MKSQLEWEALRYVLEDPTLDVADFEARMATDVDLALAVATAVGQVEQLRLACGEESDLQVVAGVGPAVANHGSMDGSEGVMQPGGAGSSGWHWVSVSVLAAGLMLAVGSAVISMRSWRDSGLTVTTVQAADSQAFVETWLVFQQAPHQLDETQALLTQGEDGVIEPVSWLTGEQAAASEEPEAVGEDWMLDAAREFYAQGVAS